MMKDWMPNATREMVSSYYQQLHYQFVASARAVQRAHETDPDYQVGCMLRFIIAVMLWYGGNIRPMQNVYGKKTMSNLIVH